MTQFSFLISGIYFPGDLYLFLIPLQLFSATPSSGGNQDLVLEASGFLSISSDGLLSSTLFS